MLSHFIEIKSKFYEQQNMEFNGHPEKKTGQPEEWILLISYPQICESNPTSLLYTLLRVFPFPFDVTRHEVYLFIFTPSFVEEVEESPKDYRRFSWSLFYIMFMFTLADSYRNCVHVFCLSYVMCNMPLL